MKIVIITNLYPNPLEPSRATYNKYQFQELAKHCELKIIAPIAWTDRLNFWIKAKSTIPFSTVVDGIDIFHPTYYFPPRIFRSLYGFCYFFSIASVFRRLNQKFAADAIFATWAYPDGYAAAILGKITKLPFVVKVHGSDIHSIKGVFRKKLTAWALCSSQKVFSVSEDLTKQICSMGIPSEKILTLYNGVDEKIFFPINRDVALSQLNLDSTTKRLLFVGNLKKIKGADLLPDVFSRTIKRHPELHLYIIGQGVLKEQIEDLLTAKQIDQQVTFLGVLPHEKIALWMNSVDLLLIPSRNEGVPNVMLEAMSCGLPVVAAKIGGIPEVFHEGITGCLCELPDPAQLSECITCLLNRNWDRALIAQTARKYTWTNNGQILLYQLKHLRSVQELGKGSDTIENN